MENKVQKNQKTQKTKLVLWAVIGLFVLSAVVEYLRNPEKYNQPSEQPATKVQMVENAEAKLDQAETPDEAVQSVGHWKNNPLDSVNLSDEAKRNLYDDLDTAFQMAYKNDIAPDANTEEVKIVEDMCVGEVAEKYGVSSEDAENIYLYAALGYLYDIDPNSLKAQHGEVQDVTIVGTTLTIKVKIAPSLTDKLTVKQNYLNVEDLIQKQSCNLFHRIRYWAVADMTDGSESKVISFDVDRAMIKAIAEGNLDTAYYESNLTDLWIHNSLR